MKGARHGAALSGCQVISAETVAWERLGIEWPRAYTRARVRGPDARGGLPPRRRSKLLQS
jgi:hypothetical protein